MEHIIDAAGTVAFGGSGIAIVAYIYWKQAESLFRNQERMMQHQREQIERIAVSFESALDRRDKDFAMLYRSVETLNSD